MKSDPGAPRTLHHAARCTTFTISPVPAGKRVAFGWPVFSVPVGGPSPQLHWPHLSPKRDSSRLRLTVALDDREEKVLEAFTLHSDQVVGRFDMRYAYTLQPFEVLLSPNQTHGALQEGLGLRLSKGTTPLWLFQADIDAPALRPHMLFESSGDTLGAFYERLLSLDSVQPFGWLEGCVLDGLYDLRAHYPPAQVRSVIERHLEHFLDKQLELRYEDPRSEPADVRLYGIEGTLPFAVWAQLWPQHPVLEQVRQAWLSWRQTDGAVQGGEMLSAEGSYTVAYPMTVLAQACGYAELEPLAVQQLRLRRERLVVAQDIYLRAYRDGRRTFKNWSRGVAWYMLGLIRSLNALPLRDDLADLRQEARRVSRWVLGYQRPDGLWGCFVDDPGGLPDTSGSAGIAAALAHGVQQGLLPANTREAAQTTLDTLRTYLTPDGLLSGVAQCNRGGEALQRSDYRVLSQMGMGLLAQLAAAL